MATNQNRHCGSLVTVFEMHLMFIIRQTGYDASKQFVASFSGNFVTRDIKFFPHHSAESKNKYFLCPVRGETFVKYLAFKL